MNEKERLYLLDMFNKMSSLKEKHFFVLKELSKDKDSYIRSEAAALLINFESNQSKNILLRLAKDDVSLVRTEAYDSLKKMLSAKKKINLPVLMPLCHGQ